MLKFAYEVFCDLLYPPFCQICFKQTRVKWPSGILCARCREKIILNKPPFCIKCSRFIGDSDGQSRCAFCRRYLLAFDFAWSACLYEPPLKELIHHFKFHGKTYFRFLFAELMTEFIELYRLDIRQFDCLMPVALSSTRLRERGYNQSLFLAEAIAARYKIPLDRESLIKSRHSDPQALLSQKIRFTNLKGAFRMRAQTDVKNKNILLVDDLLTTGSTASEIASVLKSAGAGRVGVLTLATTV